MVAIERDKKALWSSDGDVRMDWTHPFAYEKGDCVGGFRLMVRRPSDKEFLPVLEWNADTGGGHMKADDLVKQYQAKYPDLLWVPATR